MVLWTKEVARLLAVACQRKDSCSDSMVKFWRQREVKLQVRYWNFVPVFKVEHTQHTEKHLIHSLLVLLKLCWSFPCKRNLKGFLKDTCLNHALLYFLPKSSEANINEDNYFVVSDSDCSASRKCQVLCLRWQKIKLKKSYSITNHQIS